MKSDITPTIIFEDAEYLVINKPAGLIVHSDGRTDEPSVVSWLEKKYPALETVGGELELHNETTTKRYGIVHRIDRETSGILVIAKNQKAFDDLQTKFQNREVDKKYHVFVYGNVSEERGVINKPIGRSAGDFRRRSAERGARGTMRDAVTNFTVIKHRADCAFIEAEPKTGRTHQVRVHFKAIGHPVVADKLYATNLAPILGFKRLALHARAISFQDRKGKELCFEAPYPDDFKKAIAEMGA